MLAYQRRMNVHQENCFAAASKTAEKDISLWFSEHLIQNGLLLSAETQL